MKPRIVHNLICLECGKNYQANRKDSKTCSETCRANYNAKKKAIKELKKQGGLITEQDKQVIQTANETIKETIQEQIPVLSNIVGKNLTECKRPDGKHLYTQTDLWILMAKLIRYVFRTDKSNPISFLGVLGPEELIHEFERKFKCKFDDIKKANPGIRPADTDFMNHYIMSKYANLPYSCDYNKAKTTGWE